MNFFTQFICSATAFISACTTLPHHSQIEYHGTVIHYAGKNISQPTVVFQSGLGDGMSVWSSVIDVLPSEISTFAYDRPGYGGSRYKSGQRDACTIAHELHEILHTAGRRPPYVLVGHSLGGLYQYAFAKLYPKEVSGILLIDATHPEHWTTIQQRDKNTAMVLQGLKAIGFSDTEKREFDAQTMCLADLKLRDTPKVSAQLMVRGKTEMGESAEFQKISRELATRWPTLIPGMSIIQVHGAGHYIQKERPQLVADKIRLLVSSSIF